MLARLAVLLSSLHLAACAAGKGAEALLPPTTGGTQCYTVLPGHREQGPLRYAYKVGQVCVPRGEHVVFFGDSTLRYSYTVLASEGPLSAMMSAEEGHLVTGCTWRTH